MFCYKQDYLFSIFSQPIFCHEHSQEIPKMNFSKEINKDVQKHKDAERKMLKEERFKSSEGSRTHPGRTTGEKMLGRTLVKRMKSFKKMRQVEDNGLDTDEHYMTFHLLGGWDSALV